MGHSVILGRKIGMTQIFDESGNVHPITVVEAGPCVVLQVKTQESDGYAAVKLGFGSQKKQRLRKPQRVELEKLGVEPVRQVREFREIDTAEFEVGQKITVDGFSAGDLVKVIGVSKGKGFQGVVRRHNFAGGKKTHGQSDRWRAPGSIGQSAYPSRVVKGRRMAGHMGHRQTTVPRLRIIQVDPSRNLLAIRGAVPGHRNSLVEIQTVKKKAESES